MQNQVEKQMDAAMETGFVQGSIAKNWIRVWGLGADTTRKCLELYPLSLVKATLT